MGYDKKLLWRANLYVDEGGGRADWNDVHPWVTDNEWNKYYDGTQIVNGLGGLDTVTPEYAQAHGLVAGGQIVRIPNFTPVRTLPSGNEGSPTASNVIRNSVAYSFPSHPKEKGSGDSGSMDSPFDFIWKMKQQKDAMSLAYNSDGSDKNPPSVTPTAWDAWTAPSNQWKKYLRGNTVQMFIPGFGLFAGEYYNNPVLSSANDEKNLTAGTNAQYWNWDKTFEAGADCVGFVKRAWSYLGKSADSKWSSLPNGIMDGNGTSDYSTVLGRYSGQRTYPAPGGDSEAATTIVHTYAATQAQKDSYADFSDATKNSENLELLRRVIPGDIFVKDSTSSNDGFWKEHIAIVASVPTDPSISDPQEFMNQMVLIEAEYNEKIQSVIRVLSVGDYNSPIKTKRQVYAGYSFMASKDTLNCQSWGIRRLK